MHRFAKLASVASVRQKAQGGQWQPCPHTASVYCGTKDATRISSRVCTIFQNGTQNFELRISVWVCKPVKNASTEARRQMTRSKGACSIGTLLGTHNRQHTTHGRVTAGGRCKPMSVYACALGGGTWSSVTPSTSIKGHLTVMPGRC